MEFLSGGESKCEQLCLELLLKDGDVMYFPEIFRTQDSISGVSEQQIVGSSPSRDTGVPQQNT